MFQEHIDAISGFPDFIDPRRAAVEPILASIDNITAARSPLETLEFISENYTASLLREYKNLDTRVRNNSHQFSSRLSAVRITSFKPFITGLSFI